MIVEDKEGNEWNVKTDDQYLDALITRGKIFLGISRVILNIRDIRRKIKNELMERIGDE